MQDIYTANTNHRPSWLETHRLISQWLRTVAVFGMLGMVDMKLGKFNTPEESNLIGQMEPMQYSLCVWNITRIEMKHSYNIIHIHEVLRSVLSRNNKILHKYEILFWQTMCVKTCGRPTKLKIRHGLKLRISHLETTCISQAQQYLIAYILLYIGCFGL